MSAPPLPWRWDGKVMVPLQPKIAAKDFEAGKVYRLVEEHDRSQRSHSHFFAVLQIAYNNLPDDLLEEYQSFEHFRKKLLIRTGFCDNQDFVCRSKAEALRLAAFVKPMNDYAIVVVKECVVRVLTAKSQSRKAMGAKDFAASKTMVLEYAARLIGVSSDALMKHGKAAA
jgi:hypothetical protein